MSGPKWDWGMQTAHAARATVVPCVHATCSAATPTRDIQRTLSHTLQARGRSPVSAWAQRAQQYTAQHVAGRCSAALSAGEGDAIKLE